MKKYLLLTAILVLAFLTPVFANAQNYNYNNYGVPFGSCTYHAYKLCSGNNIYWYDSCSNQQDLITTCIGGQVCQYGQCVYQIINPPVPSYQPHYRIACSGGNLYWFDNVGSSTGLYQACSNGCSNGRCLQQVASSSSSSSASSVSSVSSSVSSQNNAAGLAISFFTKQDANSAQWQKGAQVGSNGKIYFLISVVNNSANPINDVKISTNIPAEISSLGNVQVDNIQVSGDIISGISIGTVAPSATRVITFEGRTQTILESSTKQATASTSVSGQSKTDSVSLSIGTANQIQASISENAPSGFMSFLKRWYLWILAGVVLIALFIIVFRRLSSNV